MNPLSSFNSFISPSDQVSLVNLTKIQPNQVVFVSKNGKVSKPYEINESSKSWRKVQKIAGYSSVNLPKIKELMQRALVGYMYHPDPGLRECLRAAIRGLKNLEDHYKAKNKMQASTDIQKMVDFIGQSLLKINSPGNKIMSLSFEEFLDLHVLEDSVTGLKPLQSYTGIDYYVDRIDQYLTLEGKNLKDSDLSFLRELHFSLKNVILEDIFKSDGFIRYVQRKTTEQQKVASGFEDPTEVWNKAVKVEKDNFIADLLNGIDRMGPETQSQIGIPIPINFAWYQEGQPTGHLIMLSLCKEKDGTYTVAQANAGGLALGDVTEMQLNFGIPVSVSFPPIVEFRSLTRKEVSEFLLNLYENRIAIFEDAKGAEKMYKQIFEKIMDKIDKERIPSRVAQVKNNCVVRTVKELLIYNFQKAAEADPDKIALANHFFTYVDNREIGRSPVFEKILPLKTTQKKSA